MKLRLKLLLLLQLICLFSSLTAGAQVRSEQPFRPQSIDAVTPARCSGTEGLLRAWSTGSTHQSDIQVDAVWGSVREAFVVEGKDVVIRGSVGSANCELFSESPREFIWRRESLRDQSLIGVFIHVQSLHESRRVNRFFALNFLTNFQYEVVIPVDDFFSPDDALALRNGQELKGRIFQLMFKLNRRIDNNMPVFYRFTYDVTAPVLGVAKFRL